MEYLFIDTETGGLDPFKHSLLQVGLVAYANGGIEDKIEISIKENSYNVSMDALKYNGLDLYEDIYKVGVTKDVAVDKIIEFIERNFKDKPVLAGHNLSLDKYMLRQLLKVKGINMDEYINHRMIDTMSLLWGLYIAGKIPLEACSSSGALDYFGIEVKNKHRALEDCMGTIEVFEKIKKLL